MPRPSKVAVLRFAGCSAASGNRCTASVSASTRTIAFRPLSVTQAAPSGPTITPCGAERGPCAPSPSGMRSTSPVSGSSRPSSPAPCAVYQTVPSAAGATSCGRPPAGTAYSRTTGSRSVAGGSAAVASVGAAIAVATGSGTGVPWPGLPPLHAATISAASSPTNNLRYTISPISSISQYKYSTRWSPGPLAGGPLTTSRRSPSTGTAPG